MNRTPVILETKLALLQRDTFPCAIHHEGLLVFLPQYPKFTFPAAVSQISHWSPCNSLLNIVPTPILTPLMCLEEHSLTSLTQLNPPWYALLSCQNVLYVLYLV